MLIAATADIHAPRYFDLFLKSVDELATNPDLFLIAGDMVDRGKVEMWQKVYNVLFGKVHCPIVATFGNNEFGVEIQEKFREMTPDVLFLQDESTLVRVNGAKVGIVGSIGSIEWPTFWQRKRDPSIKEKFEKRVEKLRELLVDVKGKADFTILMTHYVPTFKVLHGEPVESWPGLGHRRMEKVLIEVKPNLAVCGHAHNGSKMAWVDTVPVFNVALPLNKKIVLIDTQRDLKPGLSKFFRV